MFALLERMVVFVARIPAVATQPAGAPESVRVFRAAPAYFRYRLLGWSLRLPLAIAGVALGVYWFDRAVLANTGGAARIVLGLMELAGLFGFAAQQVLSLCTLRLDYRLRHYAVTDRSLRVREGVWQVREMTMTFANVQNIEMRQGPLQRWFGIADLRVQSAGGGSGEAHPEHGGAGSIDSHAAWFRGIADAPAVRELVLSRLRRQRDAGLGDTDEAHAPAGEGGTPSLLGALRDEASAFRAAAERLAARG